MPGSSSRRAWLECTGLSVAEAVVQQPEPPSGAYGEWVDAVVYRFRLDLNAASLAISVSVG